MDSPVVSSDNGPSESLTTPITSDNSQTAQDFIASQLSLEADAREALPYQFDTCTKPLGPLRQSVYACLTCSPPPASSLQQHTPAGVCYSCSISCHGEHNLVELFTKRDLECDCGTTRLSNSGTPCSLRHNPVTTKKGDVKNEKARDGNKYNQNYEGKFCACGEEYDPEMEKGTMFQCLGLGTVEDGGCGEDWWHPECLMGLPRIRSEVMAAPKGDDSLEHVKEEAENGDVKAATEDPATEPHAPSEPHVPAGFPDEDDFDHLICYKCVNAFPWIKQYANSRGFLVAGNVVSIKGPEGNVDHTRIADQPTDMKKRKAEDDLEDSKDSKRAKPETPSVPISQPSPSTNSTSTPLHTHLPPAPNSDRITLFLKEDFRDHFCRCPECFPPLAKHRQLLEEEEAYEPPLSESSEEGNNDAGSVHSGSLYSRGEAALSSIDRVRAIEGVMAYNHVRDKVKDFLKPFAESGTVVGAEDIKAYFAKLRGDEIGIKEATVGKATAEPDHRREQGGY